MHSSRGMNGERAEWENKHDMGLPALRYVDAVPFQHGNDTLICLSDPQGYIDEQLLLSPAAYFIASLLDGENDEAAIKAVFREHFGADVVDDEAIHTVVSQLDQNGFLATPRFFEVKDSVDRAFAESPTRPAYLAGRSYPEDPEELRPFLAEPFDGEDGAGQAFREESRGSQPLRGLIVPHIDFQRGGAAYAKGYKRLFEQGKPDVALIFGVAHAAPPTPIVLTKKHFETPLGTLQTDTAMVNALAAACSWDPFAYESVHRTEHSIEFQALMLSYLFGEDIRIVPILCGNFSAVGGQNGEGAAPEVERFLEACREVTAQSEHAVTVIAGADLAHVGQRFGDSFEIDDTITLHVEQRDREDLAHAVSGNAEGFYSSVMKDHNQRRVCGLNCIYATLKTLQGRAPAGDSELIHYNYAPDPAGGIVSFAGVVYP
ncbi:MAG: AmmeMemoRadiSam system protein B [Candidatus Hydrogenedentota bacterium]